MKSPKWTISLTILTLLCFLPALATRAGAADEPKNDKGKRVVVKVGDDGVQRVEVVGGSYYFDPRHIVVRVNKPVELLVRKEGGVVPHNIIVKAPEADINFAVGLTDKFQPIEFTPTKTGKYVMSCDKQFLWFGNHQEKGMEGIIEVVE
jgi:plastocyanin domain-containing protein